MSEEQRTNIRRVLKLDDNANYSNRVLGRWLHVDAGTVARQRASLEASGDIPKIRVRKTWNGRGIDVSAIGGNSNTPAILRSESSKWLHSLWADAQDEEQIENILAGYLHGAGYDVRRQVRCSAGIADIVTDDAVIEVKFLLNKARLFRAVGQVLTYRAAIDPNLRAIIVGRVLVSAEVLIPSIEQLGIEVW